MEKINEESKSTRFHEYIMLFNFKILWTEPVSYTHLMCIRDRYFPDHGRQHMAAFQIKVIIGAIQVRGHYSDIVGTILQVEALAHFQPRYFGEGVWLIRIFQRGGEESICLLYTSRCV